ncbi:MAG: hypothetical protein ACE5OQ_17175 [Woeseia sp.]
MKLRIRDNSIRLRLTQTEVDTVNMDGRVEARVSFPGGGGLDYVVESTAVAAKPSANFFDNALTISLPESDVRQWALTEQVSIAAEESLDEGGHLKILVEKDFACLAPRDDEDESDMFPHPLEGKD